MEGGKKGKVWKGAEPREVGVCVVKIVGAALSDYLPDPYVSKFGNVQHVLEPMTPFEGDEPAEKVLAGLYTAYRWAADQ